MVRADNRQDSDRPHYYSQYWLDVASGKPSAALVSAPAEAEVEEDDDDLALFAPKVEARPKPVKPVEKKPEPSRGTLTSLADLANIDMLMKNSAEMDDTVTPDISAGLDAGSAPGAGLDFDITEEEPQAASQDDFEYDEEDEEEDDDWGGSRRNKKPGKTKRREQHRDF